MNCDRMFLELREALVGGRALNEAKESTSHTPLRASPRGSIPVRSQQSLTEVTPQVKRQKKALVKIKLKELSKDFQQRQLCFLTNTLSSTMK